MVIVLIMCGFDEERVYNMAFPLFQCYFLTALKVFTRTRQMHSSNLISTVGSLFVKKGEKTIIESMMEQIATLSVLIGDSTEEEVEAKAQFAKSKKKFDIESFANQLMSMKSVKKNAYRL